MNILSTFKKNYLCTVRGLIITTYIFLLSFFSVFFVYVLFTHADRPDGSKFSAVTIEIFVSGILLTLASVFYVVSRIKRSFGRIRNLIMKVAQGNIPHKETETEDEFGELVLHTNHLIDSLAGIRTFSTEVGRGNFESDTRVFAKETDIGESLEEMKNSLKKVAEEDKKRNWSALGLAQMGEILRNHTNNKDSFYQDIVSFIVKYIQANQAGLFVTETGENNLPYLNLAACYAYERKKYLTKIIEPGDGLVGQAFLEGEMIYLTDVPDNYLAITSGLGNANPRNILIVPLKINDEINGILELASFKLFEQYQIDFIRKISENIASAVGTSRISQTTGKLLAESQQMTEELRAQEEELRQNMEEMQSTQDEMLRIQEELGTQNRIFNSVAIVSKTDLRGNITYVNDQFLKWSKYSREELIGKNHRILKSGHQDDKIFEELWKTISSGGIFRGEIKNRAKDGSYYWVDTVIAPVLDSSGKPKEYLAHRFVINDQKKREEEMQHLLNDCREKEEELRQNMEEMKSIQDDMQKAQNEMQRVQVEMHAQNNIINSIAIVSKTDLKGNITYVNDEFLKWSGYTREEVLGKNHRILKSGHQEDKIFEQLWETISSGKIFRGEIKNRAKDGSHYWVDAIIAPVLGQDGKPMEYIAQRFVINDKKERESYTEELLLNFKNHEAELQKQISEALEARKEIGIVADHLMNELKDINSALAAIEFNLDGKVLKANDKFLSIMGYTPDELFGIDHDVLVTPEERTSSQYKDLWAKLCNGQAVEGEFERVTRTGKKIKLRTIYNPILSEENKPLKVLKLFYVVDQLTA